MSGIPVEHERLERRIASGNLETGGSEAHGMLCGILCGGGVDSSALWMSALFDGVDEADLLVGECRQEMDRLYQQTREALEGPESTMEPLLPSERLPLKVRAEAVRDWSRGFLYGIGLAGISQDALQSEQTREALHDLAEITRMDLGVLGDDEDDEDALMQVSEYVWVAAMLVYHELDSNRTASS
ncbi:MAG: YecA family protein [Gammaproteobacteria bacterium]|nr:YecA family protein [Gammaproteobacteria bacterium]